MNGQQLQHHQSNILFEDRNDERMEFQEEEGCFGAEIGQQVNGGRKSMSDQLPKDVLKNEKEGMEGQPRWKQSICSRASSISSRSSRLAIHHKYSILTKKNPKISSCIKKITQQIKTQILNQHTSTKSLTPTTIPHIKIHQNNSLENIVHRQVLEDREIVKQSCFRGLLKQSKIDNDVQSDDEDLNMGIRYMYGELLYSVGSEMVNHREKEAQHKTKLIAKKAKRIQHNKQNINTNLINLSNSKGHPNTVYSNESSFNGFRARQ